MKVVKGEDDPLNYLRSDSEEEGVRLVRVEDRKSRPRTVIIDMHRVPARGMMDSEADITIRGAEVFKKIVSVANLRKIRCLKET